VQLAHAAIKVRRDVVIVLLDECEPIADLLSQLHENDTVACATPHDRPVQIRAYSVDTAKRMFRCELVAEPIDSLAAFEDVLKLLEDQPSRSMLAVAVAGGRVSWTFIDIRDEWGPTRGSA